MSSSALSVLCREAQARQHRSLTVVNGHQTLEERFLLLISKFEKDPSEKCAVAVFEACVVLQNEYKEQKFDTIPNIVKCYSANVEQYLWKNIFYCVIEIFRKAMNVDSTASTKYKVLLTKFIDQTLKFYIDLINHYESLISPQKFVDVFCWPDSCPPFYVNSAFIIHDGFKMNCVGDAKIVLRSAQRHFLAVGDLFRYKSSLIDAPTNTKLAKRWYFNAAQANLHNGRSFNQLGVLASQSRNFLDMIFFYVMALSAKYPFNSARESLGIACSQVQQIPTLKDDSSNNKKLAAARRSQTQRFDSAQICCDEIWIRPDNESRNVHEAHKQNTPIQLDAKKQRAILLKWLHLAGILVTNIGMEKFPALREQVLLDIYDLINSPCSIFTATSLLKMSLIFVFASHHVKAGSSESSANLQRSYAIRFILDLMNATVSTSLEVLKKFDKAANTRLAAAKDSAFYRVLPTLCTLTRWLIAPPKAAADLLATTDYFLDSSLLTDFVRLLNKINKLIKEGKVETFDKCVTLHDYVHLPEDVIMSSFHDIFPSSAPRYLLPASMSNENDIELVSLHCRLNAILREAEIAFESDNLPPHLSCLAIDRNISDGNKFVYRFNAKISSGKSISQRKLSSTVTRKSVTEEDDELVKKTLIGNKDTTRGRRIVLEVRPKYLVPDTNTFIDHLDLIKRIVESKKYTVLVPTVVVTELISLSTDAAGRRASGIVPQKLLALLSPELGPKSRSRNVQMQYVMRQASATIDYLKHASQERTPHLATITTNGNILSRVSFAQEIISDGSSVQTNDDRILASCIELCNNNQEVNVDVSTGDQPIVIKRSTVFLTEDRALCIKAVSAKIPTGSAPQFIKWSGI